MGINEEYNYGDSQTAQQIKNTDKELEDLCKKISIFGCCIIILLLLIYIVLILIVISLNN
jgi:uncharacterized membrane protein (DUF485 family)